MKINLNLNFFFFQTISDFIFIEFLSCMKLVPSGKKTILIGGKTFSRRKKIRFFSEISFTCVKLVLSGEKGIGRRKKI